MGTICYVHWRARSANAIGVLKDSKAILQTLATLDHMMCAKIFVTSKGSKAFLSSICALARPGGAIRVLKDSRAVLQTLSTVDDMMRVNILVISEGSKAALSSICAHILVMSKGSKAALVCSFEQDSKAVLMSPSSHRH